MKSINKIHLYGVIALTILIPLALFHFSVIIGLTPYLYVWGGNLTQSNYIQFELIALLVTLSLVLVTSAYVLNRNIVFSTRITNILRQLFFIFLIVMTPLNAISITSIEAFLGTFVSGTLCLCLWGLGRFEPNEQNLREI